MGWCGAPSFLPFSLSSLPGFLAISFKRTICIARRKIKRDDSLNTVRNRYQLLSLAVQFQSHYVECSSHNYLIQKPCSNTKTDVSLLATQFSAHFYDKVFEKVHTRLCGRRLCAGQARAWNIVTHIPTAAYCSDSIT